MRFKLTLEYAGTRYSGWQIQQNARTVQGELDRAIREVTRRADFELYGSGRTDAGVHALAQVAHLDVEATLPPETLRRRINDALPADINVLAATLATPRFHARHDAVARRYLYQIARRRSAFAKPFVWWVKESLDLNHMRRAAHRLLGLRDFESFTETRKRPNGHEDRSGSSTKVLVERIEILEEEDLILVDIEGSHFLWKMVRRLVGVLAEVGRGGLTDIAAADLLTSPTDLPARLTAPASGLFLASVYYPDDERGRPVRSATPLRSPMTHAHD